MDREAILYPVFARFSAYFGSFAVLVVMWTTLLVQLLRS